MVAALPLVRYEGEIELVEDPSQLERVLAEIAKEEILGFDTEAQALMIALYIAMDSFGTACNVTGDGAIAIVMQHLYRKSAGTSADN